MITGTLAGIVNTEEWVDRAVCGQSDPEAFFPEKGGSTKAAKRVCLGCPVRARQAGGTGECFDYALTRGEKFGIWGGYSIREIDGYRRGKPLPPIAALRCLHGHDLKKFGLDSYGRCAQCHRDRCNESQRKKRMRQDRSLSA